MPMTVSAAIQGWCGPAATYQLRGTAVPAPKMVLEHAADAVSAHPVKLSQIFGLAGTAPTTFHLTAQVLLRIRTCVHVIDADNIHLVCDVAFDARCPEGDARAVCEVFLNAAAAGACQHHRNPPRVVIDERVTDVRFVIFRSGLQ